MTDNTEAQQNRSESFQEVYFALMNLDSADTNIRFFTSAVEAYQALDRREQNGIMADVFHRHEWPPEVMAEACK